MSNVFFAFLQAFLIAVNLGLGIMNLMDGSSWGALNLGVAGFIFAVTLFLVILEGSPDR